MDEAVSAGRDGVARRRQVSADVPTVRPAARRSAARRTSTASCTCCRLRRSLAFLGRRPSVSGCTASCRSPCRCRCFAPSPGTGCRRGCACRSPDCCTSPPGPNSRTRTAHGHSATPTSARTAGTASSATRTSWPCIDTRGPAAARPVQHDPGRHGPLRQADGPQRPALDDDGDLLLDGPGATPEELKQAHAHRRGRRHVRLSLSSSRPCASAGTRSTGTARSSRTCDRTGEPTVLPDAPLGYLTAYRCRSGPKLDRPVELWPRLLQPCLCHRPAVRSSSRPRRRRSGYPQRPQVARRARNCRRAAVAAASCPATADAAARHSLDAWLDSFPPLPPRTKAARESVAALARASKCGVIAAELRSRPRRARRVPRFRIR